MLVFRTVERKLRPHPTSNGGLIIQSSSRNPQFPLIESSHVDGRFEEGPTWHLEGGGHGVHTWSVRRVDTHIWLRAVFAGLFPLTLCFGKWAELFRKHFITRPVTLSSVQGSFPTLPPGTFFKKVPTGPMGGTRWNPRKPGAFQFRSFQMENVPVL